MKTLLIISVLIGGNFTVKESFPVVDGDCLGYVSRHPAIVQSWQDIYGPNVSFTCREVR